MKVGQKVIVVTAADQLPLAFAWSVGIGFVSYVWARVAYHRAEK